MFKNWFSKHPGWTMVLIIVGLFVVGGCINNADISPQNLSTSVYKVTTDSGDVDVPYLNLDIPSADIVEEQLYETSVDNSDNSLSNDNYYINTYGNEVHSPAYSNTVPAGASAQCVDGTYSFSQSRRGTCSHHGGVMQWL